MTGWCALGLGIAGLCRAGGDALELNQRQCQGNHPNQLCAKHPVKRIARFEVIVITSVRNRVPKTKSDNQMADRDLYSGLIRLHVLHHAVEEPIFGLGMVEELARHGYRISPGTLYPLLHGLEKKGYLRSTEQRSGKSRRKVYRATPQGRNALAAAKSKVRELFRELIEGK